jgi:ADP-heptose:LPS heptosyltransferase
MSMTPKYVRGGIGDMLQCVESAIAEKDVNIFSHFSKAPDIFFPFGVNVSRFELFNNVEELNSVFVPGEPLERKFYPQFSIPDNSLIEKPSCNILGIHIEGSKFSNDVWSQRGQPTKNMSEVFLVNLFKTLPKKWFIYLFCAPERTNEIGKLFADNAENDFYVISFSYIWDSLACVPHCSAVLGMDSSIKTMASMLRIPSVVLVGDYVDVFRDENFLNPYVNDGHMEVVKYKNIDDLNPKDILKLIEI